MSNSPYDLPPRASRFSQNLDHLCQWKKCQRPAHPEVPVPLSLCGHHWVEVGLAYQAKPMHDLARSMRADARYWTPPRIIVAPCIECGDQMLVDSTDMKLACSGPGCSYRAEFHAHKAAAEVQAKKDLLATQARYAAEQAALNAGRQHPPVVYYIQFGDRIKIGTSTNLQSRLTALPHDAVLAVEPGSFDVERRRHAQFAKHRLTGEWFAVHDELTKHIEWTAKMHPFAKYMPRPAESA